MLQSEHRSVGYKLYTCTLAPPHVIDDVAYHGSVRGREQASDELLLLLLLLLLLERGGCGEPPELLAEGPYHHQELRQTDKFKLS